MENLIIGGLITLVSTVIVCYVTWRVNKSTNRKQEETIKEIRLLNEALILLIDSTNQLPYKAQQLKEEDLRKRIESITENLKQQIPRIKSSVDNTLLSMLRKSIEDAAKQRKE